MRPGLARLLSTVCLVALLAATAAAYAVTNDAALEPSPIVAMRPPAVFSPLCDCDTAVTTVDFRLRKSERLTVWAESDGKRVRTLVADRTYEPGLVQVPFEGVSEGGLTLPQGVYRAVVRLDGAHRTIALPYAIVLDLKPPAVRVRHRVYSHISPDGDGRKDVFRVPYRLSEPGRAILLVDGRQAVVAASTARRGVLRWNGKVAGRVVAPGNHVLRITARDVAGNRAKPFPFAVVQIRYVSLGRDRVLATPGGRFAILALSDAASVSWRFNQRRGVAQPGTLRFKAPRKPGVYRLYVSSGGHADKALVVVA
jgi:hypothetical protein